MITNEVKAWVAGFWEGEGSASCYRYRAVSRHTGKPCWVNQSLQCQISQKSKAPLLYIQKLYGGSVGRYKSSSFNSDLFYKYGACAKTARTLLLDILPFIRTPKRRNIITKALSNEKRRINSQHPNYAR